MSGGEGPWCAGVAKLKLTTPGVLIAGLNPVATDAVGTAVMGKPQHAPAEGDSLNGFVADLTQAQIGIFFDAADPLAGSQALLRDATTRFVYDLDRFRRTHPDHELEPAAAGRAELIEYYLTPRDG